MADTSDMTDTSLRAIKMAIHHLMASGFIKAPEEKFIVALVLYGSRVYGTATERSDYDYLVVTDSASLVNDIESEIGIHNLQDSNVEVTIVSSTLFASMLAKCEIRAIETIFTPKHCVPIGYDWIQQKRQDFAEILEIDRAETVNRIRSAFSKVSSNSEVKARKKIVDREYMIALKSLFHSIRILMFGIQIGEYHEIRDFEVANECWDEIQKDLIPKIDDASLTVGDCRTFYAKWAKTPRNGETMHLLSRFKDCLRKI